MDKGQTPTTPIKYEKDAADQLLMFTYQKRQQLTVAKRYGPQVKMESAGEIQESPIASPRKSHLIEPECTALSTTKTETRKSMAEINEKYDSATTRQLTNLRPSIVFPNGHLHSRK